MTTRASDTVTRSINTPGQGADRHLCVPDSVCEGEPHMTRPLPDESTPSAPTRASVLWLGILGALAVTLWVAVIILMFSLPMLQEDHAGHRLLVSMVGLGAATVTIATFSLGARYLLHDSIARDHAKLLAEFQALREQVNVKVDDSTAEISSTLLNAIAQQAMIGARLAALAEQLSAKIDRVYWKGYEDSAHDRGFPGAEVFQLHGQRGGA